MDIMPYITLHKKGKKTVVEVKADNEIKTFTPTLAGAKKIANFLVEQGAEELLHSSSLDHYEEYGVKLDILAAVIDEWQKILSVKVICWWVCKVSSQKLTKIGPDNTPFDTEEKARELVRGLKIITKEKDSFYVIGVLNSGNLVVKPV